MAYAENTTVPVDKSLAEINCLLKRSGADRIAQAEEPGRLAIQCFLHSRLLRFMVHLPGLDLVPEHNAAGARIPEAVRQNKLAQHHRQRARALLLVIKAKLESVESGVESFEEAFLANVVMPDGQTVADKALPLIGPAYESGQTPQLMLAAP